MQVRGSNGVRKWRGTVVGRALSMAAGALAVVACNGAEVPPAINGGPGAIAILGHDAGAHDASADRKSAGTGGAAAGGGAGAPATGQGGGAGGGSSGATGGITSGSTGGSAGGSEAGAGGGGSTDDPCVACEKAKCAHPTGLLTTDLNDSHNGLAAAMQVCFGGGAWPASLASADNFCAAGLQGETGATAAAGDAAGMPKTTLCQALLACIHRTNCTDEPDVGDNTACYCGSGVSLQACLGPTFTPMGQCLTEFTNAMESNQLTQTNAGYLTDLCLASGAALDINLWCDSNCCVQECLKVSPSGAEDLTYCGAAASGGASGTGGRLGTGGVSGTGGVAATGGMTGSTGGVQGTGGLAGAAGAGGIGGAPPVPPALTNGTFASNTAGWTAGFGVVLGWSPNDAGGSTQSGSLDVASNAGDASLTQEAGATQCLSVTPGAGVHAQAVALVRGQVSTQASINLWFYGSADCSGAISGVSSSLPDVSASWEAVSLVVIAPGGAHSVAVRLAILKPIGQTAAEAQFDNVSVTMP